jgi:DNA-binding IclR family transcriptional regulator
MIDQHGERYVPGDWLAKVGRSAGNEFQNLLRQISTPYLVDLYQATGATVCLGVLSGAEVHYVDRIYGHRSVRTPLHHSDRAPAHRTAIGRVLLAHSRATEPAALSAELSDVRRLGIAHNRDEYVDGVESVATLVMAGQGLRPPVGIAVSGKVGQLDLASACAQLRRTAFALSMTIRQTAARSRNATAHVPALRGTQPARSRGWRELRPWSLLSPGWPRSRRCNRTAVCRCPGRQTRARERDHAPETEARVHRADFRCSLVDGVKDC